MRPGWQAAAAGAAALMLLLGIAAISRLQIRSDAGGWAISFGRSDFDVTALKQDILADVEKRNQESRTSWIQEVRSEIARAHNDLSQQQQSMLAAALARMDTRVTGRIANSEAHVRDDTQKLVSNLYDGVALANLDDMDNIINFLNRYNAGPESPNIILRFDEMEKGFAGSGTDLSGDATKLTGSILTWFQDKRIHGIIFVGVPGCGKSELIYAWAKSVGKPVVNVDIPGMQGSLLGQSRLGRKCLDGGAGAREQKRS